MLTCMRCRCCAVVSPAVCSFPNSSRPGCGNGGYVAPVISRRIFPGRLTSARHCYASATYTCVHRPTELSMRAAAHRFSLTAASTSGCAAAPHVYSCLQAARHVGTGATNSNSSCQGCSARPLLQPHTAQANASSSWATAALLARNKGLLHPGGHAIVPGGMHDNIGTQLMNVEEHMAAVQPREQAEARLRLVGL